MLGQDIGVPAKAGYEKGHTELLAALAGANLIYEAAAMYGSLLAASLESFVLDNDQIASVLRSVRGIAVTDETLAFDTIREVCVDGPGHFLGHSATLSRMETDYVYPAMGDRSTPQDWADAGGPDLLERARERTAELLAAPHPHHLGAEVDAAIRRQYRIHLAPRR